jgi:phosphoribosylaminoimidazolecarboxamide formyltransferase / IMP cyclohydrolase
MIKRALISVYDKTGLQDLGRALARHGVEILSTGGSAKALAEAGIKVREVADYTGSPEMMDGRVKTLHPKIHGGLLGIRNNPEHAMAMRDNGIGPIDLVVVNLYPFEETVAKGADLGVCIENIDIGGPAMIRSAAKNHGDVTIVVDPADYAAVIAEMDKTGGETTIELRRKLAAKAYARTAEYDAAISSWFAFAVQGQMFPETLNLSMRKVQDLLYGENPHQKAAVYKAQAIARGLVGAKQVQGKELSYNNYGDTEAALDLVSAFDARTPAIAIIKHANPCGVAVGKDLVDAYNKALACDPVSAFGGIVAANGRIDKAAAEAITGLRTDIVVAPEIATDALPIFAAKKNLRVLTVGPLLNPKRPGLVLRSISGGFLVQSRDNGAVSEADLKIVTKRKPSKTEMADLLFAFTVAKYVKSNAIVYAKNGAAVGIGAGQMSRVDSARIAAMKAMDAAKAAGRTTPETVGSVVASDAFFPFADGLLAAAEAGATAVIQPGGSVKDDDVIRAADEAGLAMVFTGMRHFRH